MNRAMQTATRRIGACHRCMARALLLGTLVLALAACGFHLRGAAQLPAVMRTTYLDAGPASASLAADLRAALRAAGVQLVEQRAQAGAVLRILGDRFERRVLSVRRTGKVEEYELYRAVRYELADAGGQILVPAHQIELRRDYLFDPQDVLGTAGQEAVLRRDMERDVVRLILLQLEAG